MGAYSITQIKILQTRKTREFNLFNAIPKTFKDAKYVPDGFALALGARSSAMVDGDRDDSFELWT